MVTLELKEGDELTLLSFCLDSEDKENGCQFHPTRHSYDPLVDGKESSRFYIPLNNNLKENCIYKVKVKSIEVTERKNKFNVMILVEVCQRILSFRKIDKFNVDNSSEIDFFSDASEYYEWNGIGNAWRTKMDEFIEPLYNKNIPIEKIARRLIKARKECGHLLTFDEALRYVTKFPGI